MFAVVCFTQGGGGGNPCLYLVASKPSSALSLYVYARKREEVSLWGLRERAESRPATRGGAQRVHAHTHCGGGSLVWYVRRVCAGLKHTALGTRCVSLSLITRARAQKKGAAPLSSVHTQASSSGLWGVRGAAVQKRAGTGARARATPDCANGEKKQCSGGGACACACVRDGAAQVCADTQLKLVLSSTAAPRA